MWQLVCFSFCAQESSWFVLLQGFKVGFGSSNCCPVIVGGNDVLSISILLPLNVQTAP